MSDPVVVLLAAGFGRRFGGDKLCAKLPDGTPLALAALQALRASGLPVVAIVRSGQSALAELLAADGTRVVEAEFAQLGMGHTIAAGVAATASAPGWLIALADMPWIRPASVAAVAETLRGGASLVVPCFNGQRGHPVGFAAEWRQALTNLTGDEGARRIVGSAPGRVELALDDPGILRDVDTPEALFDAQTER